MTAWHIACKHRLLCGNRCFFAVALFPGDYYTYLIKKTGCCKGRRESVWHGTKPHRAASPCAAGSRHGLPRFCWSPCFLLALLPWQVNGRCAPLIRCWPTTPSATRCRTPSRTKHRPLHAMCASLLLKRSRPIPPPALPPSKALRPCPSVTPVSAKSAMPAHGTFCRGTRVTGRSGMLFCSFRPRQIPILNRCTM